MDQFLSGFDNLTRRGTLALLAAVDRADQEGTKAKASKSQPCEAVTAYLDASFLGPFLRSGQEIPYMENAGVLGTFIGFLDKEWARGALHSSPAQHTHLKLLAYVTAIEGAPLSVFGNCLEFLAGIRKCFDFEIYYGKMSAHQKLDAVSATMKLVPNGRMPKEFEELHGQLGTLIDRTLRNAIAHATYRIHSKQERVDLWDRGKLADVRTFKQVDDVYQDAQWYRVGFVNAVGDFAREIHPECPYVWHP